MGDLADSQPGPQEPRPPAGHSPGIDYEGRTIAHVRSKAMNVPPHKMRDEDLLEGHGFDPTYWRIRAGTLRAKMWDMPIGQGQVATLYWYDFYVDERLDEERVYTALADMVKHMRRWKTPKRNPLKDWWNDGTLVACVGDTQFGKADGDGTDGTTARWKAYVEEVVTEARRRGHRRLAVLSLGDLIEHCIGFYADQAATVDRTLTEQLQLCVELLIYALKTWACFDQVDVYAVPGNHGQTVRRGGKQATPVRDNFDLMVWRMVAMAAAENTDLTDRVSFHYPEPQETTMAVDIGGLTVGLAHGHQWKGPSKWLEWWKGQVFGRRPVGDADLLVNGHYHHTIIEQPYRRGHIQIPALDGGSQWFKDSYGCDTPPGGLMFSIEDGEWSRPCVV